MKRSTFRRRIPRRVNLLDRFSTESYRQDESRRQLGLKGRVVTPANIGRNHPDYGMTVAEHMLARHARAVEASKQIRQPVPRARKTGQDYRS